MSIIELFIYIFVLQMRFLCFSIFVLLAGLVGTGLTVQVEADQESNWVPIPISPRILDFYSRPIGNNQKFGAKNGHI